MNRTKIKFTALFFVVASMCACQTYQERGKATSSYDLTTNEEITSIEPSSSEEPSSEESSSEEYSSEEYSTSYSPSIEKYYSSCEGLTGTALYNQIKAINKPVSPSYDWTRYEDADEAEDDPTSILCIYTRHNIKKSSHCGSYSWTSWNREHIWTQSKYPKSKTDNHNIFACEGQINNYRGNLPFGEVEHIASNTKQIFGHDVDCYWTSSYFEPCDAAKGEVARSVLYGTLTYDYTMTLEIQSVELALRWHLQYPISSREIKRNETVYGNQGNRNPFVDHPDYACKIWGNTDAKTKATCGIH